MSVAARTREAVRADPFLYEALRSGAINYRAAARELDVSGEEESIATALRRYAEELDSPARTSRSARVRMRRGVGPVEDPGDSLLTVGETVIADGGGATAILATGDVDAIALEWILGRLRTAGIRVAAAGIAADALVVVVGDEDGADALRTVEAALEDVPD